MPKVVRWDSFCYLIIPGENLSVKEPSSLSIPPGTPTSSVKDQNASPILHCNYYDEVPKNRRFNEKANGWSENTYYFFLYFSKKCIFYVKVLESQHIMFVVSVIQFARFVKFLRRGRDPSFFSAFIDVLICLFMCIFVLIAACFVSVGFNVWCQGMTKRFPTCGKSYAYINYF